jgi:hypothetical protein
VHRRNREQKSAAGTLMRKTDIDAIESVMSTGLLSASEEAVAREVIAHHMRNIRIRSAFARILGPELSSRVLGRAGAVSRTLRRR